MPEKYPDLCLADRHKDYSESLVIAVSRQPEEMVEAKATAEARKLYNMHRQVWCEIHRIESFTRLKTSPKGILYATIKPEHKVEDIVVWFFSARFPLFIIAIESKGRCYVASDSKISIINKPLANVVSSIEEGLIENKILSDISDYNMGANGEDLWNTFYETQYIKERRNKRYFHKSMPRKILRNTGLGMELRGSIGTRKLKDFV